MQKRFMFIIVGLLMTFALVGCSSQIEDELVTYQNDFKENVADPIEEATSLAEEKEFQLEAGEIDEFEFIAFLEDDFLPTMQEKRTYIADYPALETDEANDYKELLDDNALTSIDFLEKNSEFLMEILTDEDMTEEAIMEHLDNLELLLDEIVAKDEAVEKRQNELEDEYNIEFYEDEEE